MRVEASGVLLAPVEDFARLLGEPYHLPAWWPGRRGVESTAQRRTQVTVAIEPSWWRVSAEGLRGLPRQAVARFHDLCQTAAEL